MIRFFHGFFFVKSWVIIFKIFAHWNRNLKHLQRGDWSVFRDSILLYYVKMTSEHSWLNLEDREERHNRSLKRTSHITGIFPGRYIPEFPKLKNWLPLRWWNVWKASPLPLEGWNAVDRLWIHTQNRNSHSFNLRQNTEGSSLLYWFILYCCIFQSLRLNINVPA
jgi:hypothetical protein